MAELSGNEEYLISLCPKVKEICQPVFDELEINFFRFVCSYPDGMKYCLSNDADWLRSYFEEKFYNLELANYAKAPKGANGISLHGACLDDNPVCDFWNRHSFEADYNNILDIYDKTEDYYDVFTFGVNQKSHAGTNVFLNNFFLFKHFVIYFYDIARNLILDAQKHSFKTEIDTSFTLDQNWMVGLPEARQKELLSMMKVQRFYINNTLKSEYLTADEVKLLKLFSMGYAEEDIAQKYQIPEQKVQQYFDRICKKLKVNNTTALLSLVLQKPLSTRLASFYFK